MTIMLLVARSILSSMDQAPRSAFLSAVVLPDERTAVMGIVNTVKTMSQSSGPLITGTLASDQRFWIAFVLAGSLKASYDLAMLSMFVNTPLEGEPRNINGSNVAASSTQGHQDGPVPFDGAPTSSRFEVGDDEQNSDDDSQNVAATRF